MEDEMGSTAAAAPTAASPPHDSDFTPVGSPEDTSVEGHALPSDEEHDNDEYPELEQDHDQQDQPSETAVQTEDLKRKIIKQVEYYFSDENLPTDKHMISLIKKQKEGFVPITNIASFRKMKKLSQDHLFIVAALRESSFLVVSSDGKKVKRLHPFSLSEVKDPKFSTVLVENLPEDHSVGNIRRIFSEAGKIKNISIRDPLAVDESKKVNKVDTMISTKLHALVEYETVEAAEKAVATLNDEQDWRNGMRVKLLKQAGKYRQQRRQVWKESDSERNNFGRASNQTIDEENHNLSEHNGDTHDEEDGEHASKDKPAQRGRNRGRPRRNKYHVNNGLGHGTTSSAHIEPSKPPPGPKMPDGTRGFTMGRGRPPVA